MSEQGTTTVDRAAELKVCPDCRREYIGAPEDDCCAECFDDWDGMTLEEIIGGE